MVVANRLPVRRTASGWEPAPGGLVTGLLSGIRDQASIWVGVGSADVPSRLGRSGVELRAVHVDPSQLGGYYTGFANRTLWPILHNAVERPVYDRSWWNCYRAVNDRFAAAVLEAGDDEQPVWVHDYHLMLLPALVRAQRAAQPIGFFLHVPWPEPEIFARLPWRSELVRGLLGADVLSFQTEHYRDNFIRTCLRVADDDEVEVRGSALMLRDGRVVWTNASPISINPQDFAVPARPAITERLSARLSGQFDGRRLLLGVDRLDYAKGIVERLLAFEQLLVRRPDLGQRLSFVQIAVPSRGDVHEYRELRTRVEAIIGRINGRFTEPGGDVPVHFVHRNLAREQLIAYYRRADLLLVTPLADGMNLVAKEYIVVQDALGGVGQLVLSEFAGAVAELPEARLCNPFDIAGLSRAIEQSLDVPPELNRTAIAAMSRRVRGWNATQWAGRQLAEITRAPRQVPARAG